MDGSKPYPIMHRNAIHHVLTMAHVAHVVRCTFPNCPTDSFQVCNGDLPRFVFFLGPKGISGCALADAHLMANSVGHSGVFFVLSPL